MNTKEEIKKYIILELERVKNFPELNYPADLGKDYYKFKQKEVDLECFRYGKTITRIWVQQRNNRLLLPDMPERIAELCIELKEVHRLDLDLITNISQFCEYYTSWKNLEELINGASITYENMFKWPSDCKRITDVIIEKACMNGVFVGFAELEATVKNQLHITFDVLADNYLRGNVIRQGSKDNAKKIFLKKFGWNGYRGGMEMTGQNDIKLNYNKSEIYTGEINKSAQKDIIIYFTPD